MTGSTVYTVGANQKVLALNPTARQRGDAFPGEGEWQYPTEADRKVGTSFTAPVAANGTVYASIYQLGGNTGSPGAVVALDQGNGAQKWRFDLPTTAAHLIGPPVVVGNAVYIGAADYYVYSLNANTGATNWQFRTGNKVWAGITVDDSGTAYIASLDHKLYAVDTANGTEKWRFETGGAIATAPLYKDGKVYFGSADGYLYALDVKARAGNQAFPTSSEWKFTSGSWFWATPAISGNTLYASAVDGGVYALSLATGAEQWHAVVSTRDAGVSATPLVTRDLVAVAGQDGRVYALDPATGAEKWRYTTDPQSPIFSPLTTDGTLLYGYSQNQRLIALDPNNGTPRWVCRTEKPCNG